MKINLQNRKRKELADHIGEILGAIPRYLGVPTCNYQIGNCILEHDGKLTISDSIDAVALLNHLKERGWESGETDTDRLTISVPRNTLSDEKLEMLEKIIAGKASLLKKVILHRGRPRDNHPEGYIHEGAGRNGTAVIRA